MAGNIWERTGENTNNPNTRSGKGGQTYDTNPFNPVSYRSGIATNTASYWGGFRPVLYIQDEPQKEYNTYLQQKKIKI